MKIAVMGTQGTGKTTRVDIICKTLELLEIPFHKLKLDISKCPHPINKKANFDAQMWRAKKRIEAEIYADSLDVVIVCDRTIYDSIPYTLYSLEVGGMSERDAEEVIDKVLRGAGKVKPYDKIWMPIPRGEIDPNSPLRDNDKGWQMEIFNLFENVILAYDIKVERLK